VIRLEDNRVKARRHDGSRSSATVSASAENLLKAVAAEIGIERAMEILVGGRARNGSFSDNCIFGPLHTPLASRPPCTTRIA
jgi:hypothetical protein